MARIKKFAPEQKLSSFQTFIVDENLNSEYFRITEFKDTFTGGKNGFLIEGSEYLKESTEIKIEILDVNGEPVYFEPGNGIPEYYEGISKLIAVYIYEDTPIGLGKITVLGELKEYDDNGVKRNVPTEWEGSYNVKWERTFQINKNLSNEDRVRFYRRPKVDIDEIIKPIFNKTPQTITQTGQVDGLPLIPIENTQLSNFSLPTTYRLKITDETYWTGSVVGQQMEFSGLDYSPTITDIVNKEEILVDPPYAESDLVKGFSSQNYSVSFPHIEGAVDLATALTGSFAKINITDMKTFVGDAARVKVFRKSISQLTDFEFVQEIQLESNELLRDLESVESTETFYGNLSQNYIDNYWLTSSNDLNTTFNQDFLYNSIELDNNVETPQYFFTSQSLGVTKDVEYNLSFNVRKRTIDSSDNYLKVYLSGSFNDAPTSQLIANIGSSNELLQKTSISENIVANDISSSKLYFEVKGDDWLINNISLRAAEETSFSPDEMTFIQSVPKTLAEETFEFRFEFYDINNNFIPVLVEETKTFNGGNLNLFTKELTLTPNQLYFAFDSASAPANPLPPTNVFIDVEKRVITGSVTFTSGAYDEFNNLLSSSQYAGGQFPGLLTDRDKDIVKLNVSDFTGSRDDITVQYIEYTGEVEGVTDSFVITRVQDGKGGVNFEIRPFRGTIIKNKDDKELEIQAIRIDGINEIKLKDNLPQTGFSDAKLRVLSSSIDEVTLEESGSYILLSEASSTKFIKGLNPGLTGSGEIDYNARFNRDSIDGELSVFLMDGATSESILTSIILTDLQDGLDSGFVTFDADVFTINPRTQKEFIPQFSSVTGSFYKRGTKANPVSASIEIFPSMSINPDFVPEYWMYFVSHSKDESIEVTAFDENGFNVTNGELNSYVGLPASQSKQLLVNFTYTEPITSASVQVDHIFTIVPEGKPGDETVLFEVNPQVVNLHGNSRGEIDDFKQSITDISLRQGSQRLLFTGSREPGTFTIASESIITENIDVGLLHLTSSFGTDYTASLIVSESSNFTQLSGSIEYPLEIRPYFTSSVYTQSFSQNFIKTLDGAPPIEVILTPTAVTLVADEVEFVPDYGNARTTVVVKEGSDNLINTASGEPGTFIVESIEAKNITAVSSSNVEGTVSGSFDFLLFDYPFLSASAVYNINVFPFSLGPGHEFTSSIFERTQTFVKSVAPAAPRNVELQATTTTVTYDGDGSRTSPTAPIVLTATAYNTSGSVYYGFYRDGYVWNPYSQINTLTLSSGDETERGGSVTWEVRIKDGGINADVVATDTVTISGIQDGANNYNVQLDNPSVTLTVDIDGGTTLTNSGATIRANKGSTALTHVTSYSFSDYVYDELGVFLGNIGQYSASVHSVPPYLEQNDTFSGNPARIDDIANWNQPFDNPGGSIVYKVDIENGRATYFLSQSFAASFEGKTGPGVVVRGEWTGSVDYTFDIQAKRRDAVVYKYDNGGTEEIHYFGTTQTLTPNKRLPYNPATGITDEPFYDGTQSEGDIDDFGWEYLGQQDFFVAAKIGIFEESFIKNTVNVGSPTNDYDVNPQITIHGGDSEPYISIGQGTQGYGQQGIFLGVTEDGGPNGTAGTTGLISVEDDTGDAFFRWDGYGLEIKSDDVLIETDNLTIDSQNEKISLGQGTQGFQEEGIFIGNDSSEYKLSLTGAPVGGEYNALEWDGSTLTLRGALRQTAAGVVEASLRGTWAAGTTYYPNDTVQYLGETWSSNTQHTATDDTNATTGRPGSGPWTIAAGAGKGVNLIADTYVISYDADGSNPSPSGNLTLTANSSNFIDGYFKFTGGGSNFTDETSFTDGTGANTDTATLTIPTTYFSTPLQFRVGVAEGDQVEKVSDTITIVAVQPGSDVSPMFSIATISGGTQIKNNSGTIELQAQQVDSTGVTNLSSGDVKIFKDDSSLLNVSMSGIGGDEYNPTINEDAIDGTLTLELRDTSDDSVLDTITLLDVTDGLGGGSFISPNLKTNRDTVTGNYAPTFLSITASFFSTDGTEYTQAVRITPTLDGSTDNMFFENDSGAHTDPNGYITLTLDDGDGTVFSGTGSGNKLPTKDVVITAEFQDPVSGQTNKIVETLYIVSDGADGLDAITVTTNNPSHTVPAESDGTPSSFAGSGIKIEVYEGANKLSYDGGIPPADSSFSIGNVIVNPTGDFTIDGTPTEGADFIEYGDGTAMNSAADVVTITYGITGSRASSDEFRIDTTQTITKVKDGESGTSGVNGTDGAAGQASGIVYAGEWKLTLPDGSTPNLSNKLAFLSEDNLVYVVKEGSNYFTCETTHRYCGTSTGGNVVGDVVLFSGNYYIANKSTADDPQEEPADWDVLGPDISPGASLSSGYTFWASFGAEFTSVATDILFANDVYADKTINVGTDDGSPVIALNADADNSNANPRIQIGQVGGDGFLDDGIYLGYTGSAPALSLVTGSSFFSYLDGVINLSDANFFGSGSIIEGSAIRVGETSPGSNQYNFLVDTLGNMTAASGSFQGTVTAIGGNIGTWEITNEALSSELITLDAEENQITVADTSATVRFNANSATTLPAIASGTGYSEAMSTTTISRTVGGPTGSFIADMVENIDLIPVASGTGFSPTVTGKHKASFTYNNGSNTKVQATGFGSFNELRLQLVISTSSTAAGVTNSNIVKFGGQTSIYAQGYDEGGGGPGGFVSVVGNTEISLSDGSIKLAKDVTTKDKILVWNENISGYSEGKISQILSRKVNSIFRVNADGKEVEVSDSHGFWLDGGDEIKVKDIVVGETQIYIKDGDTKKLVKVDLVEEIFGEEEVFTFSVPKYVNYISNDIISHNIVTESIPITVETVASSPHTYTVNNVDLTIGTTYYAYMRALNRYYVADDEIDGYEIFTQIKMNGGNVTISPLSAGVIVNGGGFQSVVDDSNYFRFRTNAGSDPYSTDLIGGLSIDKMYGYDIANSNLGYLKPAYPWVIKAFVKFTHTTGKDTDPAGSTSTPSTTGNDVTFQAGVGIESIVTFANHEGVYQINYEETFSASKIPTVIAFGGRGQVDNGFQGNTEVTVQLGIGTSDENGCRILSGDNDTNDLDNVREMAVIILG